MRRLILISLVAFGALAADARACSCAMPEVDRAQGAFVGRVAEVTDDRVTFDVEATVKGGYSGRVEFDYLVGDGGNCGANLREGDRTGVVIHGQEDAIGMCNLMDPAEMDVPQPSGASLLGALLGTCWSVMRS
jgi:hypothetical protein